MIGASLDGGYDGEGARIAEGNAVASRRWCPAARRSRPACEPGDVILELDGKPVEGSSELIVAIRSQATR